MTSSTDFDRVIAEWLTEGPTRAPDHPVDQAIQHALGHPRRRDPLASLRRDPMAAPGGFVPLGRPMTLVTAVLLLLVAVAGVAVVGSRLGDPAVVPPVSPSPAPSAFPSGPPALPGLFDVDLEEDSGNDATLGVIDESGLVVAAVSGSPIENPADAGITIANDGPATLVMTWTGGPCDTVHVLRIDSTAKTFTLERPKCLGDAIPRQLSVVLTMSEPIDAAGIAATIVEGQGNGLPNWTATGVDAGGNRVDMTIFDDSGALESAESFGEGDGGASVAPGVVAVTNETATSLRLTWASTPCHDEAEISIAADLATIQVDEASCADDTLPLDRILVLTFDREVDAASVSAAYTEVER
jgi:hypothetical protein